MQFFRESAPFRIPPSPQSGFMPVEPRSGNYTNTPSGTSISSPPGFTPGDQWFANSCWSGGKTGLHRREAEGGRWLNGFAGSFRTLALPAQGRKGTNCRFVLHQRFLRILRFRILRDAAKRFKALSWPGRSSLFNPRAIRHDSWLRRLPAGRAQ